MPDATPTDVLREEHRVILKALDVLDGARERLSAGERVADAAWHGVLDWLRTFADARHHAKEERVLFPTMLQAGVPAEGGPVQVMLEEHELARSLIAAMAEGPASLRAATADRYVRLLRDHIDKENLVLFPLADDVLDEQTVAAVRRNFEAADIEQRAAPIDLAEAALEDLAAALGASIGTH